AVRALALSAAARRPMAARRAALPHRPTHAPRPRPALAGLPRGRPLAGPGSAYARRAARRYLTNSSTGTQVRPSSRSKQREYARGLALLAVGEVFYLDLVAERALRIPDKLK